MPSHPHIVTSDSKNKVEGCRLDDPLHVDTQWGVTYEIKDHQNKGAFFKLWQQQEECFPPLHGWLKNVLCYAPW